MTGRLLGVDYGEKRIGLALSDALGIGARALAILPSQDRDADCAAIAAVARREGAVALVVGVPENPNAPAGIVTQAQIVRGWIASLRQVVDLPIYEVSEYLSSQEARQMARAQKRAQREPIDDLAARVILQAYLDSRRRPTQGAR